jgi:hypothetical protein
MAVTGVRSSWDRMPMKVSRRWSDSSRAVMSVRTARDDSSPLHLERADRVLDRNGRPVPSAGLAGPLLPVCISLADQHVVQPASADLLGAVAETLERLAVGVADAAVRIGHQEDARVRLERGAEPCLALELCPGGGQLEARILQLAREHAALADGLPSLVGTGGLRREQAEEHDVVLNEQRPGVRIGDEQPLARDVGLDRDRDPRGSDAVPAGLGGRLDIRVTDDHAARWLAADDPGDRWLAERHDARRPVRDHPRRLGEGDPDPILVGVEGRADQRLADVERDGALLEATQRHGREEGGQVADPGGQREEARQDEDAGIGGGAGGRGGGSRTGHEDAGREQHRGAGGDLEPRPGVADASAAGSEQDHRRDELDGDEICDDEQRQSRVAARADEDRDRGSREPHQRAGRQPSGHGHEMAREMERQVRLQEQDDPAGRGEPLRELGPDAPRHLEREQGDDRPEDEHEVAMDRPRLPQVTDHDDDEDGDECELQRDVDGVHGSLDAWLGARASRRAPSVGR